MAQYYKNMSYIDNVAYSHFKIISQVGLTSCTVEEAQGEEEEGEHCVSPDPAQRRQHSSSQHTWSGQIKSPNTTEVVT